MNLKKNLKYSNYLALIKKTTRLVKHQLLLCGFMNFSKNQNIKKIILFMVIQNQKII